MRQIIAWCALTLAGCTAAPSQYGNFVPPGANQQQLGIDAAHQLAMLWPPGTTRFALSHATSDTFGTALIASLRGRGYALTEYYAADQAQASAGAVPTGSPAALSLRYVLDQADATNLYRLTLWIGSESITRPYLAENGSFVPAGYWVRKEKE